VKCGGTVASDWFSPVRRVAETLRSAPKYLAKREVGTVIVYAGDESTTQLGVRVMSWREVAMVGRAG